MMKRVLRRARLLMLHAAPVHAIDKTTEIPVLIAESVDARGNQRTTAAHHLRRRQPAGGRNGTEPRDPPLPWRRAVVMAEQGEGLLYGAATPERQPFFKFTKPVYDANQWLVSRAMRRWCSIRWEDLRDKVISIGGGGKFGPEFEARRDILFKIPRTTPPPKTA
jgi:ABC-type amino acid transport substrate-binding protein